MRGDNKRAAGFTLIELLASTAIIALLVALLLPALSGARRSAITVEAMAAARSLLQAHALYAGDHAGAALPAYLDAAEASGVTDEFGNELFAPVSQRWAYRLAPYFDHVWAGTTHVGARASLLEDQRAILQSDAGAFGWSYQVSVFPSFGINRLYVGGDRRRPGLIARNHHVDRLHQAFKPSRLLTFASSRFDVGTIKYDGYLDITPPPLGTAYDEASPTNAPATSYGNLHARYRGRIVAGWLDGHTDTAAPDQLGDRRLWANPAARLDDPVWEPQ